MSEEECGGSPCEERATVGKDQTGNVLRRDTERAGWRGCRIAGSPGGRSWEAQHRAAADPVLAVLEGERATVGLGDLTAEGQADA